MLLRMYLRWAERRGFEAEIDEATEGQEAGLLSATVIVKGRFAYGLALRRARSAPPRADVPVRCTETAADELRDCLGHPVLGGCRMRGRHRREGSADRHLPLVGGRRPARQQDRLGRSPHPPSDRDRRLVPERAQPAPEQGAGDADPRCEAGGPPSRGAHGRARDALRDRSSTLPGGARSARTSWPRTGWSRTTEPSTRPATSRPSWTAISTT